VFRLRAKPGKTARFALGDTLPVLIGKLLLGPSTIYGMLSKCKLYHVIIAYKVGYANHRITSLFLLEWLAVVC